MDKDDKTPVATLRLLHEGTGRELLSAISHGQALPRAAVPSRPLLDHATLELRFMIVQDEQHEQEE